MVMTVHDIREKLMIAYLVNVENKRIVCKKKVGPFVITVPMISNIFNCPSQITYISQFSICVLHLQKTFVGDLSLVC